MKVNKIIPMIAFSAVMVFLAFMIFIPRLLEVDIETETRYDTLYIEYAECGSVVINGTAVPNYATSVSDVTKDVVVTFTDQESYLNAKNYIGEVCEVQYSACYSNNKFIYYQDLEILGVVD